MAEQFAERGIKVLVDTEIESVERPGVQDTGIGQIHGGPATVVAGGSTFEVDEIVVAAGRTPATDDLGLERIGIDVSDSDGYLTTDDHMTVVGGPDWLYAVGDVNGRALLTHMGKYQARIAGDVIAARAEGRSIEGLRYRDVADHDIVPAVVFSQPQVASVGLTEATARERGDRRAGTRVRHRFGAGASVLRDGYSGKAKLVVDRASDTLVGATFVGPDVAELLHAATIAIVGKVPLETLWHAVPSYPDGQRDLAAAARESQLIRRRRRFSAFPPTARSRPPRARRRRCASRRAPRAARAERAHRAAGRAR